MLFLHTWERLQRVCIASLEMSSMGPCRKFPYMSFFTFQKYSARGVRPCMSAETRFGNRTVSTSTLAVKL